MCSQGSGPISAAGGLGFACDSVEKGRVSLKLLLKLRMNQSFMVNHSRKRGLKLTWKF